MRRRWMFWVELFSIREAATSLALFRIALGSVLLYALVSAAAWEVVDVVWLHSDHGGMRVVHGNWFLKLFGGTTPGVVWTMWTIALVSCLLFVTGALGPIGHRIATLILLQSYNALITINPYASGGYDLLLTNALWIMVFADSHAAISLWARRHPERAGSVTALAWPRYVLIFQLLLMYGMTGVQKTSITWSPGGGYSALYYVTQDPTWIRWPVGEWSAWLSPVWSVATAMTWHWEHLSPLLLLWFYCRYTREKDGRLRRWVLRWDWRYPWAAIGFGMHLGILILLNVGPFSWISLSYYLLLWRPEEWRRFGSWLRAKEFAPSWPGS